MSDKWGPPVWTLFHTMAEKIHEDKFPALKQGLLSYIRMICVNLPCPNCSMHAQSFLNKINFGRINDKATLQNFLYTFHNTVNARKNKPVFDKDRLIGYGNVNLISAFNNFEIVFNTKGNMKLLADSFQRTQIMKNFKKWFVNNVQSFSA